MSSLSGHFCSRPIARNFLLWPVLLLLARLSAFADQSVTLTWSPSPNTNVAGYKIYYGGASRAYTNTLTLGNVTNVTVSGLSEGTTYFFGATTLDGSGVESDFSNEATYTIPLTDGGNPVPVANQPPTLDAIANLNLYQNAGLQTIALTGITSGSVTENQTLTLSVVSSNPSIIPNPTVNYSSPNSAGSLTFAPVTNALGTATMTVTIDDGGASNNVITRTFTVTVVTPVVVNQPPTLNPIADLALSQNAATQTIKLTGISSGSPTESQVLKISASSSNPLLVPAPKVSYTSPASTGALTIRPAANGTGVAMITVTVNDGGKSNNIVRRTFNVTVQPNQPPTLAAIPNVAVAQNAAAQNVVLTGITSGSPTENQVLKISASSSNPRLVPAPRIQYASPAKNALLVFKPSGNLTGTATITVTVNDGGKKNNTIRQHFTVTVTAPANNLSTSGPVSNTLGQVMGTNAAAILTTIASTSGQFGFKVAGVPGGKYIVQATTDLVHWTSVQTNTAPFDFQDGVANGFHQRFYRAVYAP